VLILVAVSNQDALGLHMDHTTEEVVPAVDPRTRSVEPGGIELIGHEDVVEDAASAGSDVSSKSLSIAAPGQLGPTT